MFCLLTALQFHGLTTQLPSQVWIAMPRGSHSPRIDYPPIRMVQMAGGAHLAGVEEHLCNGVKVRIYSPAKTVVDCFKHRNKIPDGHVKFPHPWPPQIPPGRTPEL